MRGVKSKQVQLVATCPLSSLAAPCWHEFARSEARGRERALSAMLKYVQQTAGDKRKREEDPNVRRARPSQVACRRVACRRVPPASALTPILAQVRFYARKIESRPQGAFVDVIHATWDGQWERLERLHGYIQWLFPVFENAGMNWESSPLTKEGARQIRESEVMSRRVLASYRLMLRFFGFILVDERTGAALTPHPRMASHRSRTPRSPSPLASS